MSVTVNDHRKHIEGKARQAEAELAAAPKPLLPQVGVAEETGDAHLDKLARIVTALRDGHEKHAQAVALKGIGCVQEDMLKLQQFEYFYEKGKVDFANKVLSLPAEILLESTTGTRAANV